MTTYLALILFAGAIYFGGCSGYEDSSTPEEYIYLSHATPAVYHRDSVQLDSIVQHLLDSREQAFYPNYYDEDATFEIKEILYSPDNKRLAFFIVSHVEHEKLFQTDKDLFNGDFYIGEKNANGRVKRVNWIRMGFSTNTSSQRTFKGLRAMYFVDLATWKGSDGKPHYGVNVNDIRFWHCEIWEEEFRY